MHEDYILQSSPKGYSEDQDKSILPEETYQNAFYSLSKTFPDLNFTLTKLSNNEFYSVYDFDDGFFGSHGKGATQSQSMASAIMEYSERKSWYEFDMGKAKGFIKASYNYLKDKVDMGSYKDIFKIHYYTETESTEDILSGTDLLWVEGYNLTSDKPTLIPVNFTDLVKSSNGLAAGNTKEEAITQGLCELIEREHIDNFLLDPYNAKVRLIDHSTLNNPYLLKLLEWATIKGIQIYFIDISNTINVTTILVHAIDHNSPNIYSRSGDGYGTHNDPEKAMIRAFTEFLQGREAYVNNFPEDFDMTKGQWQTRLILDFTRIINNAKTISVKGCFHINSNDFKKDAEKILSILKQKGHEVIALNLTHKELKIPVYRLLIPTFKTGDEFSPFSRNQHYTVAFLLKNGRHDDKAWEYYLKYKKEITEINEESTELIRQINKHMGANIDIDARQKELLDKDVIYWLLMPRNHIVLFIFASYFTRAPLAAMSVLLGTTVVDGDKAVTLPELELELSQKERSPS
ncbi:MAG: YcaO-like family protein [Candidatus Margulisbacteria bacterium]|nr:YcaO-like family protein [Candidatus Margulisiibacteriota bacterium]